MADTTLPVISAPLGEKVKDQLPVEDKTATQGVEYNVFTTNARLRSKQSDPLQAFGTLYIGLKTVTDNNHHAVLYKPFSEDDDTETHDISHTVSVRPTADDSIINYVKVPDPLSPYRFDINITSYGGRKASWKHGLLVSNGQEWEWSGSFLTTETINVDATIIDVPTPDGWNQIPEKERGTPAELDAIWPIAHEGDGAKIKQGDDAPQVYADDILQNIMFHTLEQNTIDSLLPGSLKPLSNAEIAILNDNKDFFKRGAVHLLAEQLKKQISPDLAKHIMFKWDLYLRMLTTTEAIPSGEPDPAVLYGFTRGKDDDLIAKLQLQFRNASMACYELGYIKKCPEWTKYTSHPKYWFMVYRQMILSKEHIARWLAHTTDTQEYGGPTVVPGKDQVQIWSNKLSLLKHAAEKQGFDIMDMDIEHFSDTLLARLHEQAAYSQLLNEDFVKAVNSLFDITENTQCSEDFKKRFAKLNETARDASDALRSTTTQILTMLLPTSDVVGKQISQYWNKRLPKPAGPVEIELQNFSAAQVAEAAESAPISTQTWTDKVKAIDVKGMLRKAGLVTLQAVKSLIKVAIHGAAVFSFYSFLKGDTSHMSISEMGTAITSIVSEACYLVGWVGSKVLGISRVFTWAMGKGGIIRSVTAWFTNSIKAGSTALTKTFHALLGDVGKLVRVIGIVGCVFNLITAYWGMQYAGADPSDKDAANYRTYSKIQFALGVVEGVALVGGILCDIIGFAVGSMICGPLALVVGILAGIAMIVYMIWFAPDPQKDVKTFLDGEAKDFGSYSPDKTESIPDTTNLKDDRKIKDAATAAKTTKGLTDKLKPVNPPRVITALEAQAAEGLRMNIRQLIFAISVATDNANLRQHLRDLIDHMDHLYPGILYIQAVTRFQQGWDSFQALEFQDLQGMGVATTSLPFVEAAFAALYLSASTLIDLLAL